jgi:hypothetical protein
LLTESSIQISITLPSLHCLLKGHTFQPSSFSNSRLVRSFQRHFFVRVQLLVPVDKYLANDCVTVEGMSIMAFRENEEYEPSDRTVLKTSAESDITID